LEHKKVDYINKDSVVRDEIWELDNPLTTTGFKASNTPEITYKYYNLTTQRKIVTPPETVINRPNCGGLNGCNIEAIEVRYLRHVIKNGEILFRQEISTTVSAEIPPLFIIDTADPYAAHYPVVEECFRFMSEGAYIKYCLTLEDLDKKE
jgi:hypothetical protein